MLIKQLTKVDKLTKRVENIYDERQREEDEDKRRQARRKECEQADDITKTDFWCTRHGDTTGMAYKVIFRNSDGLNAYYEAFNNHAWPKELMTCGCKGLRRWITDKHQDPYYVKSEKIRLEARKAQDSGDLLQPGDWMFDIKYPEHKRKLNERLEKEAKANWKPKIMI